MGSSSEELRDFLSDPLNSVTREKLLYNRFYFDMKLAAARAKYALTLYEPDVDRDGFDVVIDDNEHISFVQLKTVLNSSKTRKWAIRRKLLCLNEPDDYCVQNPHLGKGGAVILIEFDPGPKEIVSYYVTDWRLLHYAKILLSFEPDKQPLARRNKQICDLIYDIENREKFLKTDIKKGVLLKARDADAVLALLGHYSKCQLNMAEFDTLQSNGVGSQPNWQSDTILLNMFWSFNNSIQAVLAEPSLSRLGPDPLPRRPAE